MQVEYDSAVIGVRDVLGAVTSLGYEAALLQNDELSAGMGEREKEKRFWRRKVLWSLAFSVPVFLLAMVFSYLPRVKDGLNTSVAGFTVNELVQWILTTPVQVRRLSDIALLHLGCVVYASALKRSSLFWSAERVCHCSSLPHSLASATQSGQ